MRVIGVTGGLSSGKSTAAGILNDLGCYVIDIDKVAHEILTKEVVKQRIKEKFGKEKVFNQKGDVDRKKLGEIVFKSKDHVRFMNKLIHPLVIDELKERLNKIKRNNKEKLVVVDIPLLFEAHLEEMFDSIIVVYLDQQKQVERCALRNPELSKESILSRIACQIPLPKKAEIADYVIDSDCSFYDFRRSVESVLKSINSKK